ncbi:MAG: transposase [Treponema sp.]|nr:transposase [Treponema sp.]
MPALASAPKRLRRRYHLALAVRCRYPVVPLRSSAPVKSFSPAASWSSLICRTIIFSTLLVFCIFFRQPQRKSIVEHPFGAIKRGMDTGYCLTKGLRNVAGEFSLTFLAYNIKRVINILGCKGLIGCLAR